MATTRPKNDARALEALNLRLAGASYREIGGMLGVSGTTAFQHVQRMLRETAQEPADAVREAELARLDRLLLAHWSAAIGDPKAEPPVPGDRDATRMVLQIMDRRARYLGLDAPTRIDVTGWIRGMAEREGIDPEQAVRDAEAILREATA